MIQGALFYTDFGPVVSLTYVTPPTISNSVTYYYTGGSRGPTITDRGGSSYYTVTDASKVNVGTYTFRVALKNKSTSAWSTGGTADITGTYYVKYNTDTISLQMTYDGDSSHRPWYSVQYTDEYGNAAEATSSQTIHPKSGSTVSYWVDVPCGARVSCMGGSFNDTWQDSYNVYPTISGGRGRLWIGNFTSKDGTVTIEVYYGGYGGSYSFLINTP